VDWRKLKSLDGRLCKKVPHKASLNAQGRRDDTASLEKSKKNGRATCHERHQRDTASTKDTIPSSKEREKGQADLSYMGRLKKGRKNLH